MLKFDVVANGLGVAVAEALPSFTVGYDWEPPLPAVLVRRQSTPNLNACLPVLQLSVSAQV